MADLTQDVNLAVYAWVLEHQKVDPDLVAAGTGITRQEAAVCIKGLVESRLVHVDADNVPLGYAVSPEVALAQLSAPIEGSIREQQQQLSQIREELDSFAPAYCRIRTSSTHAFEVVASLHEVRAALNDASARCTEEMLTCQPGGGSRVPEAMEEAMSRDHAMLSRGVRIRTLYHHTARFNGPSQTYVAAASALGAEYRTAHELFGRLIVFDRSIAFIPVHDGSWGAVIIREHSTVAYLCSIFDQAWDAATPFANAASEGLEQVSHELRGTILRLLAAGLKDETIARRLGMSLRTVRRHVADIMVQLNAESRFQAGVIAAIEGLFGDEVPAARTATAV